MLFSIFLVACSPEADRVAKEPSFVSLSPSITEVLIVLGITDKLKGVTRFCNYTQVEGTQVVGDLLEPSIEKMTLLKPRYILVHPGQNVRGGVKGAKNIVVKQNSISAIHNSVRQIAHLAGVASLPIITRDSLFLDSIFTSARGLNNARVLIIVSSNVVNRDNVTFFAASSGSYLSDVFSQFGLVNVLERDIPEYAQLTLEEIVRLAPDLIVDVSYTERAADFLNLPFHAEFIEIRGRHATIPGPISLKKLVIDIDSTLHAISKKTLH